MRVLIIGGTGFIGPWVVRQLHAQGHAVTIYHRGQTEINLPAAVTHVHGERHHLVDHGAALRRIAPEVVLDMYAMTEADATAVMTACRGVAGRVVAISSIDVYRAYDISHGRETGPPEPVLLTEESPLRSHLYPYRADPPRAPDDPQRADDDYDKILVERVVLGDPTLPGTVLRLPMVYGPGDNQHRLFDFLKRMDDARPAILLSEGAAAWRAARGYVENVAAAIALAVVDRRAAGRVYNVADVDAHSLAERARLIAAIVGWPGQIVTAPAERLPPHLWQIGRPDQHWVVATTRLRHELGYQEPVPLDEALRRTIAWERAHPPARIDPARFDYAAEDAALAALGFASA